MTSDVPADAPDEFARSYWRSAPPLEQALAELSGATIDDATFRLLADTIPIFCWVANGDGYIVWYNRRWHDYCGTTPAQMEGWGWQAVHDPALLPEVMARWTAAIRDGEPFEMTFPLRGADGLFRPFLTRVQPVRDATDAVVRWFGVNIAVWDQVAAEQALRLERDRNRDVLEGMGEAFVLLDHQFRVVQLNAEAVRLERRPAAELIGRVHWEAWPDSEGTELARLFRLALADGVPVSLEYLYTFHDGRVRWLEMRAYPSPQGLSVFYRDVTERRKTSAAIAESEQRLRLVVDGATDYAIITIDLERRITSWSNGAAAIFGYDAGEAIGQSADIIFTPEDLADDRPAIEIATARQEGCAADERWHLRRDGSRVFMNGSVRPLPLDAKGREQGYIKIARDETERRRTAEALAESESRFRNMADQAPVMMWVTDPAGVCTYLNRRWYEFTGQAPGTGEGFGWLDAVHAEDRPLAEEAFRAANATQSDYRVEFRVRRADGLYRWAIDAAAARFGAGGAYLGHVGSVIDIDERREAELALRDSTVRAEALAAEQAAILGQLTEGVVVTDALGRITFVNEAASRIHGVAHLGVAPDRYSETYHLLTLEGEPYPSEQLPLARAVRHNETVLDERWRIRRPDGSDVLAIGSARPVVDPGGRQIGAVLTLRDDTARTEAERALRDNEARLRALTDTLRELNEELEARVTQRTQERDRLWRNTQDLQVVIDGEGRFQAVSPAATPILGWYPEEMIGRTVFDFILPEDQAPTTGALHHAQGEALPTFVNRYRHKDGGFRWMSWVAAPEGELIYASGRHVTAEKQREAELEDARQALRQSQKMEAVGQLTGGIAHDFNNMLAVVIGSLDLLGRRLDGGDARAVRYVDAAMDGARRAALLTQRLLAFSRQQPLNPKPIDVNQLVAGMSELIRGSLGSDVRFETVLAAGGWRAHADPNQLENVVLNLAVNARDAMPGGGRLTVETQNAHIDGRYAAAHLGVPAGQYVLIAVTDTGGGMTAEVIAKAFDPFFTTKDVGKGTGLGLSQVYGFVKQSGGHVKIYSEPGHGTTVKIYLPRLVGSSQEAPGEEHPAALPTGDRRELILVVEDEPAVRQFSVDALGELGYAVIEADGAAAALRLLDAHPEIMLLFTDVVMPDVNGRKLADQALQRRPDLKVLFTTGYTRNAVVHNGVLDAGVHLIGKPFTVEELAGKMREVLDG